MFFSLNGDGKITRLHMIMNENIDQWKKAVTNFPSSQCVPWCQFHEYNYISWLNYKKNKEHDEY